MRPATDPELVSISAEPVAGYDLPVSGSVTARPSICLNMIVKNEAHVVAETLDSVAPHISSWVIVDTGSDDGTQDVIRTHMSRLGIPGDLYERPWVNFGHNRSEALVLAQRRADYVWVMDADDTIVGTLDLTQLTAEIYQLRVITSGATLWKPQLFRDGLPIRYAGVVHESLECDRPCDIERLDGDYHIEYRHLGARSQDPETFARDRDLLLAEVDRNPEDPRTVIHLAQSYFFCRDYENASKWYRRRAEMGGAEEEIFHAKYRIAESLHLGGAPWHEAQDAYLSAWEFRPTRAEALYAIAFHYRRRERYRLAYQFARLAAEIPFPEGDTMLTRPDIHGYLAAEEQAVCASMIGKPGESFAIFRAILARPQVPDKERLRIARNRDVCVPAMIAATSTFPRERIQRLAAAPLRGDVAVSLIADSSAETETTLNSFLNCFADLSRVGRVVALDAGLSAQDRALLRERYPFVEFRSAEGPSTLAQIRSQIDGRFWLHLGGGWRFFARERLITRLTAVLDAEPQVLQVGINFGDATELTATCAPETAVRRSPAGGRYVLGGGLARGPAMFDIARLDEAGGIDGFAVDPISDLARRAARAGLRTASLDEVLCLSVGTPTPTGSASR